MFDSISVQAKDIEKDVHVKDLKEDVSSLLEKSIGLTERIEALKNPVAIQKQENACYPNPIQIELLHSHGKIILFLIIFLKSSLRRHCFNEKFNFGEEKLKNLRIFEKL